jgi:hypothetical protein
VTIFDPKVDTYVIDEVRTSSNFTEDLLRYPFMYFVYRLERETPENAGLRSSIATGRGIAVTYGIRQYEVELDDVVDLRDPDTQEWFTDTFVRLEIEGEKRTAAATGMTFPRKEPLRSFGDLLPVVTSLETGGGMAFGQAVGQWLRRHRVSALIFPSARSNTFNRVVDGAPSDWNGWNLVLYRDAPEPQPLDLFGRMATWADPDHDHIRVNYADRGSERGSFSIRGLREFNLFDFDLKKQLAAGLREPDVVADLVGSRNRALSDAVNLVLDADEAANTLWYHDVDYVTFLAWLERRWRDPSRE